MNHSLIRHTLMLFTVFSGLVACQGAASTENPYLSPIDIVASPDEGRLYVALHTGQAIAAVDTQEKRVFHTVPLPYTPRALAVSQDGTTLYVAGGGVAGQISLIDTDTGLISSTLSVGHTPSDLVISPNGQTLYVCLQFDHTVQVFDLATLTLNATIPVSREPSAMAVSPDGAWLVVTHLLPEGAANGKYTAAKVSLINTRTHQRVKDLNLPNGSMGMHGICLSPDGQYGYVTHILARYQLPTTQLERGWTNTNALSILDIKKQVVVNTVLLDDVDLGAANPWGLACSSDGKLLSITLSGTHELCVMDRVALHDRLNKVSKGEHVTEMSLSSDNVPNDLAFTLDIKQRLGLSGNGPRSVALVKNTAYVAEYFSDSISVLDLTAQSKAPVQSIQLGPETPITPARRGEQLFHNADICFQKWHSCATCHPDARVDALNWDLMNDGLGNPKNTKSMLLTHATPPSMVTGIRPNAEAAVRAGIRHILFAVRPEAEALAIDAYLKSLTPVPSPFLVEGHLSESASRGKVVFQKAGCALCHPAPLYTDQKQHPVGTGRGREKDTAFDTPALIEAWRSGPYLHDGRGATLKEVLTLYNTGDKHGYTSDLPDQDLDDLTAFLQSL